MIVCWLFTSLTLSLEVEGFVAKDGNLFEESVWSVQLSANLWHSGVGSVRLF